MSQETTGCRVLGHAVPVVTLTDGESSQNQAGMGY